jgi:hypothetical protein
MSALRGEADMPRPPGPYQSDPTDPQRTSRRVTTKEAFRATLPSVAKRARAGVGGGVRGELAVELGEQRGKASPVIIPGAEKKYCSHHWNEQSATLVVKVRLRAAFEITASCE